MKIAIIALLISLAALGLAGFATARTFNGGESVVLMPVITQVWSETECADARDRLDWMSPSCRKGNCVAYTNLLQAIAENCP